ncbi:MAG: PAS domain S-box protein [Acidobacteriota bacterium]
MSILIVVLASLLRLPLNEALGEHVPFILYFPAVAASAWFGGLWAGLWATGLSALVAWYFFLPPSSTFSIPDSKTLLQIVLFLGVSSFISFIVDALHKARRKAEESEEQSIAQTERFHTTLASIGDAVITTDIQGKVVFMNQVAESLTGWTPKEASGKPLSEVFRIVNEQTREKVESPLERVLREGKVVGLANHTILIAKDGTERPIDDSGAPIKTPTGEITGAVLVFRDITERRRGEERRREAEARFRMLADTAPVLIWMSGLDKHCDFFNQGWLDFTGRTMEQELGNGWTEGIHPDDFDHCLAVYTTSFDARREFEMEYRLRRFDGEYRWLVDRGIPRFDPDGSFAGYIGSCLDITERKDDELKIKRLNRELEQRARELQTLFDIAPVGIAIAHDAKCDFITTNMALAEMIGVPVGENVSMSGSNAERMPYKLLRDGQEIPPDKLPMQRAVAEGRPVQGDEFEVLRDDGKLLTVYSNAAPLFDEKGQVTGCICAQVDITERKQAEQAQKLLGAIVESSEDAIVSKDMNGLILSWNRGAERIFGYTAEEAIGQPITLIIPPERHGEEQVILKQICLGERIEPYETLRVSKNGRQIDIFLTASPIRDRIGRIVGASKIARDISDRKQAEKERTELLAREQVARAQAEEASRLKDEFLATVSHELRTPLNAILGWSKMLRDGKLSSDVSAQALEAVVRNAKVQSQLIEDLLDVSRIISGKLLMDADPVELALVIQSALDSVRPAADAKSITLQSTLDPDVGPVRGDANRLQQVVWNLLSNAIKFTPRGGRVRIAVARIQSHAEIVVSDSGQGIKREFLSHVFDRFRQADASSTRLHGGLGLGLAIVRHLVEMHGGSVAVESPGEDLGATFTVKLPLLALRKDEMYKKSLPSNGDKGGASAIDYAPSLEGIRVLVVDDEADTRMLLTKVLERCSAEVRVAASAQEALMIVNGWHPSIIVSDIGMPEEDGYSFIKKIRTLKNAEVRRVPAVALTAYARTQDRLRALASGYQMHVAKPIDPMELVIVVASLVDRG